MALRRIENIKIGEFPPGQAFGAYVYNVNINVGTNGEPTTVDVDLINESGIYNINAGNLNARIPRSIKFGKLNSNDPSQFVFVKSAFLVNFEYNEGVGTRTLRLKFVDGASILDKIQVVLLNKQASPANIAGRYLGLWNIRNFNPMIRNYSLPIQCLNSCLETQVPPWGKNSANPWDSNHPKAFGQQKGAGRSGALFNTNFFSSRSMVTNVNPNDLANGGVIIVGEEEFTSSGCQVPNISYTFGELMTIVSNLLGIRYVNLSDRGRGVRESFTGSLREVLNNWCALYGYSFTWDYSSDSIFGVDLQNPVVSLEALYRKISSIGETSSKTPVAISDVSRSFSIENTYKQDHVSTYVKPAKTNTTKKKITQRVLFRPFNIFNIIPKANFAQISGGRTPEELMISAVLANYNENARTLYNYYLIAKKTNNFTTNVDTYGSPLGLSIRYQLSSQEKEELLTNTMSPKKREANNKKLGRSAGAFLGTYSQELEKEWVAWERKIASFIGKYYYYPQSIGDEFICNKANQIKYIREVSTKPASKSFELGTNETTEDIPFNELLVHPNGVSNLWLRDQFTGKPMKNFYLIDRNPSYGTKDQEIKDIFYNKGEEVLKDFMPSFAKLDGAQKLFLDDLIYRCFPNVWANLEQIENESKRPTLLFFPDLDTITNVLNISSLKGTSGWYWSFPTEYGGLNGNPYTMAPGNVVNKKEYKPKQDEKSNQSCDLACDIDLIEEACECPPGETYDPNKVGLTNLSAQWFTVAVNHGIGGGVITKPIILPSEHLYSAYVDIHQEVSRTVPSIMQHFGALTNAQGTMGYKINFTNITSDIDSLDDSDKFGDPVQNGSESGQILSHVMVPGKGRMAAKNWHNQTNTSHSVAFPNETLSFTMVGLDFSNFYNSINVQNGLTSLSISLAEDGTRVSVSLSTRPITPPEMEKLLPMVEARMNSNAFIRTY